jgi:ABC-type lipoprotein export system ATPase subunit
MNILFQNVMPSPLNSTKHSLDSIWGNKFSLSKGQKVLLNASSGKGKSTFSSILFGIRSDFEGELFFDDKSTKDFSRSEWTGYRRTKLSIVFQDLQLFPDLTVSENLLLKNDLTQSFLSNEVKAMVEKLGIGQKWNEKCGVLSMGQQQRVAIIRSLLQPFEWLILDEPFSHLDENNIKICLELINERCDQLGAGFFLTSLGSNHNFIYDNELKL